MNMPALQVISTYVKKAREVVTVGSKYSYIDADIINRKITRVLLGLSITSDTNFDTVTYDTKWNPNVTDSLFQLFELYTRTDIHKLAGITYTEFKNMSVLERDLLLEYVGFKVDVTDLDSNTTLATMSGNSDVNDALFG